MFLSAAVSLSAPQPSGQVTLLITGGLQGHLEPCGCGGQRKGGLTGRTAAIRAQRAADPHALLVDSGDWVGGASRQDELKLQAVAMAFGYLPYDAAAPGERDLALGSGSLESILPAVGVPIVCANLRPQPAWARRYLVQTAGTVRVAVTGVIEDRLCPADPGSALSAGPWQPALQAVAAEVRGKADLLVVLAHGTGQRARELQGALAMPAVVVAGHAVQDDPQPPESHPDCLVVHPGAKGHYLTRLAVHLSPEGKLVSFSYDAIPIIAPQEPPPTMLSLLRFYYGRLGAEDLVGRAPQRELPAGQRFVGAEACRRCHESQFAAHQASRHAAAYQTLVEAGREVDPVMRRLPHRGLRRAVRLRGPQWTCRPYRRGV